MANDLQPLSLLFQNRLFRIPDYQRGYAWQQPQLADFWDDLVNLQSDRYHYTGLLSLKNLKTNDVPSWGSDLWLVEIGFHPCHIVDGQQRLTTFIILLNEIVTFVRNLPENAGKVDKEIILGFETLEKIIEKYICQKRPPHNVVTTYLFGYEVDNPSEEYLKYKVFCEPFGGTVSETYYTKNLKFAKTFFADNILALYEKESIEGINLLYRKLTLRLMFNIHEIDDDYDVFVAFETMNNRGKKLTNLELLKNRLIYLTTIYSDYKFDKKDKYELRKQINDAWKEVYFQLGRNETTPLSDDEFLRAHWIIYFSYSRKKGDDYIRFLLRKFSAKNIFEKKTVLLEDAPSDIVTDTDMEDDGNNTSDNEIITISNLEPSEIRDYVNSLKDMAKHWYDTFFPYESQMMSDEEKRWVDRLNRIGIGYFRPLVAAVLSKAQKFTSHERIEAFKAIERFLFVCFRMGTFNASFRSSEYYRAARSIYFDEMALADISKDINETVDRDSEYAIANFITRIEKRFDAGDGYYGWNSLKYFMYEYEYSLAEKNGIDKISWELFTRVEKEKDSIEHILPQTPTKFYWQNQFRQFTEKEIKQLSGAIGNLLPLSQSVNSGLQNDSFGDKKHSKSDGRRGYENGSHSEIAVSKENDWDARRIYERSVLLLNFMAKRWNVPFSSDSKEQLIYISFVNDGRAIPDELSESVPGDTSNAQPNAAFGLSEAQSTFWTRFVEYCIAHGRETDIALRKPAAQNSYDITVGAQDFNLAFTITWNKYISLLIYTYNLGAFYRLENKKDNIEATFGDKLDWYSSRKSGVEKRIIYKREAEIFNPEKVNDIFGWMVDSFDSLRNALVVTGEII